MKENKNNLSVTEKMVEYIVKNEISAEQAAKDTQVPVCKLRSGCKEPLLASEFLQLCQYFGVRPEEFK